MDLTKMCFRFTISYITMEYETIKRNSYTPQRLLRCTVPRAFLWRNRSDGDIVNLGGRTSLRRFRPMLLNPLRGLRL
jgi:hypothetical protein